MNATSFASPRQIGHRLTVCWVILSLLAVSWMEPSSLGYAMRSRLNAQGQVASVAMFIMAAIGLVDAFADLCGRGIGMLARHRTLAYVLLSFAHAAVLYSSARAGVVTWILAQYAVPAMSCIWIAFFDVHYNKRPAS